MSEYESNKDSYQLLEQLFKYFPDPRKYPIDTWDMMSIPSGEFKDYLKEVAGWLDDHKVFVGGPRHPIDYD